MWHAARRMLCYHMRTLESSIIWTSSTNSKSYSFAFLIYPKSIMLSTNMFKVSRRLFSTLEPLFDRVLVRKIEAEAQTKGGIMLPDPGKTHKGEVVAVGAGARNREGDFYKPVLKKGDKVMLPEYGGNKVEVNGETHWVYREGDIVAKLLD